MKRGAENPILTIRLNEAEHQRFWRLMDLAKSRNAYVGKSDVLRELLGLNEPSALTKDEIHFFRTGQKKGAVVAHISGGQTKEEVEYDFKKGVPLATSSKQDIPFVKTTHKRKRNTR